MREREKVEECRQEISYLISKLTLAWARPTFFLRGSLGVVSVSHFSGKVKDLG